MREVLHAFSLRWIAALCDGSDPHAAPSACCPPRGPSFVLGRPGDKRAPSRPQIRWFCVDALTAAICSG
ncbi:hypothetical protein RAN3_1678 [plant metagenome]|uniref:Uncharacterized protein n=1 Tax=plant metagenome TaxID=1297885 RepID=A0A484TVW8_9ZZZZ